MDSAGSFKLSAIRGRGLEQAVFMLLLVVGRCWEAFCLQKDAWCWLAAERLQLKDGRELNNPFQAVAEVPFPRYMQSQAAASTISTRSLPDVASACKADGDL